MKKDKENIPIAPDLLKAYSLEEVKNRVIGAPGTPARDVYEFELQLDLLGETLKKVRESKNLTQEELGKQLGVGKSQISKLEKNASNVTLATVIKVFHALRAKVSFKVEI